MAWGCNHCKAALTRALAEPGLNMARSASLQKEGENEAGKYLFAGVHQRQKLMGNPGILLVIANDSLQHV